MLKILLSSEHLTLYERCREYSISVRKVNQNDYKGTQSVRRVVNEHIQYKSYVMTKAQFMLEETRENRLISAVVVRMLWFFTID